jgi:gamma-glutamyltranspeptidase/glutathione hydrolase
MRDFHLPGRSPIYSTHGLAATSHPLATLTAVDTLRAGGNAVDAAIAAAAVLCVVEPQSTGIGGDCFALYAPAHQSQVVAFNGSGRAPAAATVEKLLSLGIHQIDRHSPHAVTIPGAVDGWSQLVADYGRKPLGEILQPAIQLAEEGYPVYPRVAEDWQRSSKMLRTSEAAMRIFLPHGRSPRSGERHAQPELAHTLRAIATQGRDGFYQGAVAEDIVTFLQSQGGLQTLDDFAATRGEYVTPISTAYGGFELYECPPNGQGITALLMLNLLQGFDLSSYAPLSVERLHLEIEAARLAYGDRDRYVADPTQVQLPIQELLSLDYAADLRRLISFDRAMPDLPPPKFPTHPDTVYLCVVDVDGNAISFIQSIFHSFGSGLVSPKAGVTLHSRGAGFRVDPHHFNCIAPCKRPLHTIIPAMLMQHGQAIMPFGVMGADYQPTGQTHVLTNILDYGMDVQIALDCPRVFSYSGVCQVERGIPAKVAEQLAALGHRVQPAVEPLGGGQAIWINQETGILIGGSDPRKDGCALAY